VTPEPVENPEPTDLPDPVEGPLDPFDGDVPLAAGPDDLGFLRVPGAASRGMAALIDIFVAFFLITVADLVIIAAVIHPSKKITHAQSTSAAVASNIVVLVVAIVFIALQRFTGATIGERMLLLQMVQLDGQPPTIGRLCLRYGVMFVLSIVLFPLGAVFAILSVLSSLVQKQRRSVFDLLAGTRLVPRLKSSAR
jgi:uncharacterized RDD family membrane protein YckC